MVVPLRQRAFDLAFVERCDCKSQPHRHDDPTDDSARPRSMCGCNAEVGHLGGDGTSNVVHGPSRDPRPLIERIACSRPSARSHPHADRTADRATPCGERRRGSRPSSAGSAGCAAGGSWTRALGASTSRDRDRSRSKPCRRSRHVGHRSASAIERSGRKRRPGRQARWPQFVVGQYPLARLGLARLARADGRVGLDDALPIAQTKNADSVAARQPRCGLAALAGMTSRRAPRPCASTVVDRHTVQRPEVRPGQVSLRISRKRAPVRRRTWVTLVSRYSSITDLAG